MRYGLSFILPLVLTQAAAGQAFIDPFNLPTGTLIPGYTEQRGDWMATGTRVQSSVLTTHQELTLDGFLAKDVCVDVMAEYDVSTPTLQYEGPLCRYTGSGSAASYFMFKIQDNSSGSGSFNTAYLYWYDGSGWTYLVPSITIAPTTRARVRLQVVDRAADVLVTGRIDSNDDGTWDYEVQATTTLGFGVTGNVGVVGYRNGLADDFSFYNVPVYRDPLGPLAIPSTGNVFQGSGNPGDLFIGGLSGSRAAVPLPLGGPFFLPVDWDYLFNLTVFVLPSLVPGFTGVIDANGDFQITLDVPNAPALSGITIYGVAATFSGASLSGITPDFPISFL